MEEAKIINDIRKEIEIKKLKKRVSRLEEKSKSENLVEKELSKEKERFFSES